MITLTNREKVITEHVLLELLKQKEKTLNKMFGSETIKDIGNLYRKLYYSDYCEKNGIKFEDMTDADFNDALGI